jgi:hypothetical protein
MEAHTVVRRRGAHIFWTIGSQMAVRLSALHAGCPLPPQEDYWYSFVRGWVNSRAIVWLEGLGQLKNPITSLGTEPVTLQLVAQCLNQLCYRLPPNTLPELDKICWECAEYITTKCFADAMDSYTILRNMPRNNRNITCCTSHGKILLRIKTAVVWDVMLDSLAIVTVVL